MHYFDPARPKVGPISAYVSPKGRTVAAIPLPVIHPRETGGVELVWWLASAGNEFRQVSTGLIPTKAIGDNVQLWLENPEAFWQTYCGYVPPELASPRPLFTEAKAPPSLGRRVATLDDLD